MTHADTPATCPATCTPPHPHPQYPPKQSYQPYAYTSIKKSKPTKEQQQAAGQERVRVATRVLVNMIRDQLDKAMTNYIGIFVEDAAGQTQLDKALQAHTITDRCARERAVMWLGDADGAGSCCADLGAPWPALHAR